MDHKKGSHWRVRWNNFNATGNQGLLEYVGSMPGLPLIEDMLLNRLYFVCKQP